MTKQTDFSQELSLKHVAHSTRISGS